LERHGLQGLAVRGVASVNAAPFECDEPGNGAKDARIGQRHPAAGAVLDLVAALLLDAIFHEMLERQRQHTPQHNADRDASEFSLYRRHAKTLQPRAKFADLPLSAA